PGQTTPPGPAPTVDSAMHASHVHPRCGRAGTHMTSTHAFWLAGRQATGESAFDVTSPWDGRVVGSVSVPSDAQVEEAVAAAYAVRDEFDATPAYVRAAALDHVSRAISSARSASRE